MGNLSYYNTVPYYRFYVKLFSLIKGINNLFTMTYGKLNSNESRDKMWATSPSHAASVNVCYFRTVLSRTALPCLCKRSIRHWSIYKANLYMKFNRVQNNYFTSLGHNGRSV